MNRERRFQGLWRHPDFLKLWAGQSVSLFGSQVTRLALPLTAILTLHATPAEMGILGAVQLAPYLFLGLYAGVVVDRLHRRPILIAADLGRAVLLISIPLMAVSHTLGIELLYVVGFLLGTLELFFNVAYQSFLPSLARPEQLVQGNSLLQMSDSIAQAGGPGVGGLLVQLLTAPIAILLDALSFLASAASVAFIRAPERTIDPASKRHAWSEMRAGLHMVVANPVLRGIAGSMATLNLFANALMAVYMLYATTVLGLTPAVIGAVFALGGASTVVGTVMAGPVARRFGMGPMLIASAALVGMASFLNPLASGPRWLAVLLLVGAQLLWGIGRPVFDINELSLRQAITSDRMQGRVNASMLFIIWGVIPFGSLLGGALGTAIGLRPTLLVGAIGMALAFLWLVMSPVRRLRHLPAGVADQAA